MYRIALIGSSGGGSATISSGELIVESIQRHLHAIRRKHEATRKGSVVVSIIDIVLVQCQSGLDFVDPACDATLWTLNPRTKHIERRCEGTLQEVNEIVHREDERIATLVDAGEIDALVSISSDPEGVNKRTVEASIRRGVPIVGTGGTSISQISTMGGNVIGCSGGSVATTAITRGICFASSFAAYRPWGDLCYDLPQPPHPAKFRSVIGAALPILLAVALANTALPLLVEIISVSRKLFVVSFPGNCDDFTKGVMTGFGANLESACAVWYSEISISLSNRILPVVISALSCQEVSGLQEIAVLAGAAAGSLVHRSIVSAYLAGSMCGYLLPWLLVLCSKHSLLPTAATIISVGVSALFSGSVCCILSFPLRQITSDMSHALLDTAVQTIGAALPHQYFWLLPTLFGAALGWTVSWGSEAGYYHTVMLPLIALGMEGGHFTLLGTLDLLCLCMPCAGVCGGVYYLAYRQAHRMGQKEEESYRKSPLKSHGEDDKRLSQSRIEKDTIGERSGGKGVGRGGQSQSRSRKSTSTSTERTMRKRRQSRAGKESETNTRTSEADCISVSAQSVGNPSCDNQGSNLSSQRSDRQLYEKHIRLGRRGLLSNIFLGDFVEACYPYTLSNAQLLVSVRISCAIASALVFSRLSVPSSSIIPGSDQVTAGGSSLLSTAYIPLPLAALLASGSMNAFSIENLVYFMLAAAVAFFGPLCATLYALRKGLL